MTGYCPESASVTLDTINAKPRLLVAYCGAGGCTRGYQLAGFHVTGIDLHPQPNYCGDEFIQGDVLELLDPSYGLSPHWRFDAIHASPPCQPWSSMSNCRPGLADKYPALIEPTRELLIEAALPYVIENVVGAPLRDPVMLCGQMFGLELYRHRLFETNWPLEAPEHPPHLVPASKAGHWTPGTIMSVAGHCAPIAHARRVMGIDWTTRDELGEAIPPAYTRFIGAHLRAHLASRVPA